MTLIDNAGKFCVGHEHIDADHLHLAELLNKLNAAVIAGANTEEQQQQLEALIVFTGQHFQREEELMSKIAYTGLEKHKAEHDMLIEEVRELQGRFNSGSIALTESLFDYLAEWLTFHTATTDKKLADAIALAGK